jgi:hypothetical protein
VGVTLHALIVARPLEQDALHDAEGGEDAPAIEESRLAGGEKVGRNGENFLVVQETRVHLPVILTVWIVW